MLTVFIICTTSVKDQYCNLLYIPSSNPASQDSLDEETLCNLISEENSIDDMENFVLERNKELEKCMYKY